MHRTSPQANICVFLPNWVGDVCMATPTLRAIRNGFPDARIVGIGRPVIRDLLHGTYDAGGWFNDIIVFSKGGKSPGHSRIDLVRHLRKTRIDVAVLLTNSLWTAGAMKLAGARRIVGFDRDARGWLLSDRIGVPQSRQPGNQPVSTIDYYLELAAWLGCDTSDRTMHLPVSTTEEQWAEVLWQLVGFTRATPTVVINNGAATEPTRIWPHEKVHQLALKIADELGWQVLLHCGPKDRDYANRAAAEANHPRIASMGIVPDLPIGLSKSVLARAELVISTDSGPRHMAVALNRRVLALFGPTVPALTTTYNLPEIKISESLACRPCDRSPCPLKHHRCMRDIGVDRVMAAVRDFAPPQRFAA
jgi:heptosyltransferase-2